ncbi:MAG: hypothetical protein ABJN84_07070 [Flavobacteriaceae bacterium]
MQNFKTYIFLLLYTFFVQTAFSKGMFRCDARHEKSVEPYCDLCGCATNTGNFGFGTLSNSNFIGLRYIHQSFASKDGIFSNSPSSNEYLNTYQLWAQVPVFQNFYATASLPYQDLKRTFESGSATEALKGIGDANVMGWYKLQFFKKQHNDSIPYPVGRPLSKHSVQIGMGAKLPTGEFEERLTNRVNPGFQVGTGSFEGIFSLGYNYGGDKIGFNTLVTYYLKGENKNEYRFGNQWSYAGNMYYKLALNTFSLMPVVGISGDVYNTIEQFGETLLDTDGQILNGTLGAECAIGQFILGANASLPISQNLFGGNVQANERLSVYVNFSL